MAIAVLLFFIFLGYKLYLRNKEKSQNFINNNSNISLNPQQDNSINDYIDTDKSPFLIANSLLTSAELNFYKVLRNIISDKQIICPKVRMQDVLWTKTYYIKDKQTFINKVNRKHFDFIICDKETLKPLLAIELDDKSHEKIDRKERDKFVDDLFTTSLKFNVIHIPTNYSYDINLLKKTIGESLFKNDSIVTPEETNQVEFHLD